jgi:group I intron endonuclease
MSLFYVYLWTNAVNGKQYVGKGQRDRYSSHLNPSATSTFSSAVRKYGRENFTCTFLAFGLTEDLALCLEAAAIKAYSTKTPCGYNLTDGGEIGPTGHKQTAETKELRASKLRGRKRAPELSLLLSSLFKGKPQPEYVVEAKRQRRLSPEAKAKISAALQGHVQTEESKKKRAETMRDIWKIRDREAASSKGKERYSSITSREAHSHTTAEKVAEMRFLFSLRVPPSRIATRYDLSQAQTDAICKGKRWCIELPALGQEAEERLKVLACELIEESSSLRRAAGMKGHAKRWGRTFP